MEANLFITRAKSETTCDVVKVCAEYAEISKKLPTKDKGPFALNVLCIICRNLDKVEAWKDVDTKPLLALGIDCVRETRVLDRNDRVKTLACIYNIHRYVVRQNKPTPPELILKLSFMPFELDSINLLQEYHKTYWNILADRLTYIERLKIKNKANILKLLPKLTEDILKIIDIYETTSFCTNILVFLMKKLNFLYNEHPKELNQVYTQIFNQISKKDLKSFKKLPEEGSLELYVKLNEILYVIAENASKIQFKDANLDFIIRICISMVGHRADLFHCLQTFYLNAFGCIFNDSTFTESILNATLLSFETTEKLGYKKAMMATYPFLNQFLRLYVEYNITNSSQKPWKNNFDVAIQEKCFKLIEFLIKKLENCDQLLKCENCLLKTGLHDSLRLSFNIKNVLTTSLSQNLQITKILPIFYSIVEKQYEILEKLKRNCENYEKYYRKLQTDIHNTAIVLNKAQYYEYSIKLFDIYLKNELEYVKLEKSKENCEKSNKNCEKSNKNNEKSNIDLRNITRAFYNKSICELDSKLYKKSLIDAFLSLIFSEHLESDKYMSLVMDIKAKEIKSRPEAVEKEKFQNITVLDACQKVLEEQLYGDLMWFISKLRFSELLKHEFKIYSKLWPSIAPIGGVWNSLLDLYNGTQHKWIQEESKDKIQEILHEVILETPTVVRTIHNDNFTIVVKELLKNYMEKKTSGNQVGLWKLPFNETLVVAALLLLQFDYDMKEASNKYGWKNNEPVVDAEHAVSNTTIQQEHEATKNAIIAVKLLTNLMPNIQLASKTCLSKVIKIYEIYISELLNIYRICEGMQLAYICCHIADIIHDDETYIRNAGVLVYNLTKSNSISDIIKKAGHKMNKQTDKNSETCIKFVCEAAIYYMRIGEKSVAAKLVQISQNKILNAYEQKPEINLDISVGRLLEAQIYICGANLSTVNNVLRHYWSMPKTGSTYTSRRIRNITPQIPSQWRKLLRRAALNAHLLQTGAVNKIYAYICTVDTDNVVDTQVKIDNRLKHTLGLEQTDTQTYLPTQQKQTHFIQKSEIETMVDNNMFKKGPPSPTISVTIPIFKIPKIFDHKNCNCYACDIPTTFILTCKVFAIEAKMYFKAKETEISRNYFNGVLNLMKVIENKMKFDEYEDFIVDSVKEMHRNEFDNIQIEVLIDLAYFEMDDNNFDVADDYLVRIHEIMEENKNIDGYVANDVLNLMTASAHLKKKIKVFEDIDLEADFENLKLSPSDEPKTPVSNKDIPKIEKIIVKKDEIPKKIKVIKLNLDDAEEEIVEKRVTRNTKIPKPRIAKAVLEEFPRKLVVPKIIITLPSDEEEDIKKISKTRPKLTRQVTSRIEPKSLENALEISQNQPKIDGNTKANENQQKYHEFLINLAKSCQSKSKIDQNLLKHEQNTSKSTQNHLKHDESASQTGKKSLKNTKLVADTPVNKKIDRNEFKTPLETPEQFFTPMTSIKTYKNTLRSNIVKNLQHEFSTPRNDKENMSVKNKSSLKRATSPGKLSKDKIKDDKKEKGETSRPRRLRQQVKLSLDEN